MMMMMVVVVVRIHACGIRITTGTSLLLVSGGGFAVCFGAAAGARGRILARLVPSSALGVPIIPRPPVAPVVPCVRDVCHRLLRQRLLQRSARRRTERTAWWVGCRRVLSNTG
jgi:hypothetical protein